MAGPTTSKATLPELQAAAEGGEYATLTLVYVIELAQFVVVAPKPRPSAKPIIYRPIYLDLAVYQEDLDYQTDLVYIPGVIQTGVTYVPTECGPVKANQSLLATNGQGMFTPLYRDIEAVVAPPITSGSSYSSVLANPGINAIMVTTGNGTGRNDNPRMAAVSPNGSILWTFEVPGAANANTAATNTNGEPDDMIACAANGWTVSVCRSNDGIVAAVDTSFFYGLDDTGALSWSIRCDTPTTGEGMAASSEIGLAFTARAGITWTGQPSNEGAILVNLATGAILSTANQSTDMGLTTNAIHGCFIGPLYDRLLLIGENSGANIKCFDVSGGSPSLKSAPIWSLDKTTDFATAMSNGTSRILRVSDGSAIVCSRNASAVDFYHIDYDGTVLAEYTFDITGFGASPTVRSIDIDADDTAWVTITGSALGKVFRLPHPYTTEQYPNAGFLNLSNQPYKTALLSGVIATPGSDDGTVLRINIFDVNF